jgi:phosphate transport system protein
MTEPRRPFHDELALLRAQLLELAALAAECIPRGTEALLGMDLFTAHRIIEEDDVIDALTLSIEERCDQLLSLQSPVAIDLREVVTALRLTTEIERSADLMVNVAKGTRRLYGTRLTPALSGYLERMGEEAARLFRLAIDAYAERNAALAAALDDMDDRLDDLTTSFIQAVFDASRDEGGPSLQACVQLALIARFYERIGDHAVNIAERVQYLATGWRPEHSGVARLHAREARAGVDGDVPERSG